MRHARSLGFDALEARKLLSKAHPAVAHPHPHPAVAAVPLVLDGTLTVDNKAASVMQNDDGSTTTMTPVSGVLGGLGRVHGLWNETSDDSGDYFGPDTLQLRDSQGTFVVAFNTVTPGKAHRAAHGTARNQDAQRVVSGSGTGAYARASESGTIQINSNAGRTVVESLTLNTVKP